MVDLPIIHGELAHESRCNCVDCVKPSFQQHYSSKEGLTACLLGRNCMCLSRERNAMSFIKLCCFAGSGFICSTGANCANASKTITAETSSAHSQLAPEARNRKCQERLV